ncbi:hypothetical protein Bca101_096403 [Brassica carinata]
MGCPRQINKSTNQKLLFGHLSPSISNERTNLFPSRLLSYSYSYSYFHGIHSIVSRLHRLASRRCVFSGRLTITSQTELRFRLIRFWESRNITKGRTFIGLELLQCDEQGIVVHFLRSCSTILASSQSRNNLQPSEFLRYQKQGDLSSRLGSTLMTISKGLSSGVITTFFFAGDLLRFTFGTRLQKISISSSHPVKTIPLCFSHDGEHKTPCRLISNVELRCCSRNLALSSVSSSRVFIDKVVQPTIDYFSWFSSNPGIATLVNAEEVTKAEPMTILQIFAYIKLESAELVHFQMAVDSLLMREMGVAVPLTNHIRLSVQNMEN